MAYYQRVLLTFDTYKSLTIRVYYSQYYQSVFLTVDTYISLTIRVYYSQLTNINHLLSECIANSRYMLITLYYQSVLLTANTYISYHITILLCHTLV